jgi:hypothetical protein
METTKKTTFVKGAAILAAAGLVCKLIGVLFRIFAVRIVGEPGMKYYELVYPTYSWLLIISSSGIPTAISRLVAERAAVGNQDGARRVFRRSLLLLFLIGTVTSALMFFGAGSLAAWMVCLKPMSGVIASGNWTPTPARIISSHLDRSRSSKGSSTYRINIQYQYDVNGSHYTSNRYDFFRSDMSSNVGVGAMREIVSDMTEGKEITCLVNPANPTEAVISRSIPWFFFLFMLFPLPFLFIGGMTIFTATKSLVTPTKK